MNYGGIMYFPLNVNFFDDAPIELVEAKCGLAGITAVIKLLCKMYKEKGYYLLWDKEQCTLFAHKTGIEETNMEKIICILIDKGLRRTIRADVRHHPKGMAGSYQTEKEGLKHPTLFIGKLHTGRRKQYTKQRILHAACKHFIQKCRHFRTK